MIDDLDKEINDYFVQEAVDRARTRKERASRYLDRKIKQGLKERRFIKELKIIT